MPYIDLKKILCSLRLHKLLEEIYTIIKIVPEKKDQIFKTLFLRRYFSSRDWGCFFILRSLYKILQNNTTNWG
jgi:hypothetical protein